MSCRLSWNGKESILYPQLVQAYGTPIADDVMIYINSDQFVIEYGNYKNTPQSKSNPEVRYKAQTEDEAIDIVGGIDSNGNFTKKELKTGTLIQIGDKLFTVYNEGDEDLRFDPIEDVTENPAQLKLFENNIQVDSLGQEPTIDWLREKGVLEMFGVKRYQPTIIKEGVKELFESNPELSNAVYETLGFSNKQELENLKKQFASFSNQTEKFKGNLKDTKNLVDVFTQLIADTNFYKPLVTDISEQRKKDIISGKATTYIWEDNFDVYRKTIKKSLEKELELEADRYNYWFDNSTNFYTLDVESGKYYKYASDTTITPLETKYEITKGEYYEALDNYKNDLEQKNIQEQEDVKENVLKQPFLENCIVRLFDNHFVIVTNHTIKEEGDSFINEIDFIYYDEFNYDRLKELEEQQITPQQKQQALQLYSQYLDTIFPDSKVKDIVYHHSSQKLENFDKSFLGKETSAPDTQLGFFFAEDKNDIPKMVVEKNKQLEELGENKRLNFSVQNNVLLNIKNPEFYYGFIEEAVSNILGREARITSVTARQDYKEAKVKLESNNKDALIYGLAIEPDGEGGTDVNKGYVVFEPEQIHILGSKQDIEGFKAWVGKKEQVIESTQKVINPADFTNHSGGAIGADMMWDTVGREFGFTKNNHYWANSKTPGGNVQLTDAQLEEGVQHAKEAAKVLGRPWNSKFANLLGRNWYQVKNSTQVIAIAPLIKPGEKNSKGYTSKALRTTVDGGTGYAVEMAIANNKEVNVFDTKTNQWYKWNGTSFELSNTPVLHKNFAGIGSRQDSGKMTAQSVQAIKDVYEETLKGESTQQSEKSPRTMPQIKPIGEDLENYKGQVFKAQQSIGVPDSSGRKKRTEADIPAMKKLLMKEVIQKAIDNPTTKFQFDIVNPAKSTKTDGHGFLNKDYADIMDTIKREMGATFPANLTFHPLFEQAMYNSTGRLHELFSKDFNQDRRNLWVYDQETLAEYALQTKIVVVDANDIAIGSFKNIFSPQLQVDAIETLMGFMYSDMMDNKITTVDTLIRNALTKAQAKALEAKANKDSLREKQWTAIYTSFAFPANDNRLSFLSVLLDNFQALGYNVSPAVRKALLNKYSEAKHDLFLFRNTDFSTEYIEESGDTIEAQLERLNFEAYDQMVYDVSAEAAKGGADWSSSSFEVNPKDTASVRLKTWLSNQNVMQYDENERLTEVKNSLGFPVKVNFNKLFSHILGSVASRSELTPEKIIEILESKTNPDLKQVAVNLQNAPLHIKNEFAKVVGLQYTEWYVIKSVPTTENFEGMGTKIIKAQRNSQRQVVIDSWKSAFVLSPMVKRKDNGQRVMDSEKAKAHFRFIEAYSLLLDTTTDKEVLETRFKSMQADFKNIYSGTLEELREDNLGPVIPKKEGDRFEKRDYAKRRKVIGKILQKMFSEYNIILSDASIQALTANYKRRADSSVLDRVDKIEQLTKGTSFENDFLNQFTLSSNNKPLGMFSAFFGKASGMTLGLDTMDEVEQDSIIAINNPLYTESTTMNILADLESQENSFSIIHKNTENKSIFDFSMNTSLSSTMQYMKENFEEFTQEIEGRINVGSKGSFYLRQWKLNPKELPRLAYLDGFNYKDSETGTTRVAMSDREHLIASIQAYQNRGNKTKGHMLSLTHSDKTTTPLFYGIPKISVGNVITAGVSKTVQEEFLNIFNAEYNRVLQHKEVMKVKGTTGDAKLDAGGKFFYFLPFNKESLAKTPILLNGLYDENGEIKTLTKQDLKRLEADLLAYINKFIMNTIVLNGINEWSNAGIEAKHFDNIFLANNIDEINNSSLDLNPKGFHPESTPHKERLEKRNELLFQYAVKDFSINNWLWNVNQAMLFYGDPAQAFKKSVDETLADYAKRLAKDIAPGQDLTWENREYNTIVLSDVEQYYNFPGSNIEHSNGTDAQEVTTVKEHLNVLKASGMILEEDYNELVQVIEDSWALPTTDPNRGYYTFTKSQVDKLGKQKFQPMKPVYAGTRKPDANGFAMVDYVKSSAYPLLPNRGSEMDKLRRLMEENGIDRAAFESAKKLGLPTSNVEVFDTEGNFIFNGDIRQHIQVLDRKNLRIQQDVPLDEEKEAVGIVSQMNKLLVEGIEDIKGFVLEGKEINGKKLREEKEHVRSLMYDYNLSKLMKSLGAEKDVEGNWSTTSRKLLADKLVEAAKERGYSKNEIMLLEKFTANGDLDFPAFLHPAASRFESLLMSLVRKVSEFKIPGKSYVQSSSVGHRRMLTENEIDKSLIVYVEGFDGTQELQHMQIGKDGKVIPAQVYAPFEFFVDVRGKKTRANINSFLIKPGDPRYVENRKQIDTALIPKELTQLIGARIPNQGHNSMIPIEIVGFLPESMGDNMIVPSAITGQMGSDFDVDKIYTYKRNYKKEGSGFIIDPASEDSKEGLQNKYVDLHWSVLTHPEMYTKVLNALDKEDLKDAAKKFKPNSSNESFWSSEYQIKSFQSGKDAKALVGMTSLAVTFNAVIQNKNLILGHYELEDGIPKVKRDSITLGGLTLVKLSGNGKGSNGYSKQDNHTIFQSGAVDNAKNRYLDNLNITVATYPAVQALHQLEDSNGNIIPVSFSTALLVQDCIKEYSKRMRQDNDSFSTNFEASSKLSTLIIESLIDEYSEAMTEPTTSQSLTEGKLVDMWKDKTKKSNEYLKGQIDVLKVFKQLTDIGVRLSTLQKALNQDTNGAGVDLLYALKQQNLYDGIGRKSSATLILNEEELIEDTEQFTAFNNTVPVALTLGNTIFPLEIIKDFGVTVARLQGKPYADLSMKLQKKIVKDMRSALLSSSVVISENATIERARLQLGDNSLAIRIEKYKQLNMSNAFVNSLTPRFDPSGMGPDWLGFRGNLVEDKDTLVDSFRDLLLSKNKEERLLGEDLVKYSLLISPQGGFTSIIPSDILISTDFTSTMRNMYNDLLDNNLDNLLEQLIQHNPRIATEISTEVLDSNLEMNKSAARDYPEIITLEKEDASSLMIDKEEDSFVKVPTPYVRLFSKSESKDVLYKLQSVGAVIQYQRIDTLGTKVTSEFDLNSNGLLRSIYSDNRAGMEFSSGTVLGQIRNAVNFEIEEHEEGKSFYEVWGLENSTDFGTIERVLENIESDREVPKYYRMLAGKIKPFSNSAFSLRVEEMGKILGNFNSNNNEMSIAVGQTRRQAADTIIHEVTHMNTNEIFDALGYLSKEEALATYSGENFEKLWEKHLEAVEDFQKQNTGLHARAKEIDKLRYEAYVKFQERKNEMSPELAEVLEYHLKDIYEFVAGTLTNKNVMEFLNSIEDTVTSKESKSFVQQIIDTILDLLAEIAIHLGAPVNEKSILKSAYGLSYNFVQEAMTTVTQGEDFVLEPQEIVGYNENKINLIQDNIEGIHKQEVIKVDEGTHFKLTVTRNKKASSFKSDDPRVQIVINKMSKQLAVLDTVLSRPIRTEKDKANSIKARRLQTEIISDIENLQATKDVMQLAEVGAKQLEWAISIMSSKNPNVSEVQMATSFVAAWKDLNELHADKLGDFDESFKDVVYRLSGKSQELWSTVTRFRMEFFRHNTNLSMEQLGTALEEISTARQWGIGLPRDRNPFIQHITKLAQTAKDNVTESRFELSKQLGEILEALTKYSKANGITIDEVYKKFIQEDKSGTSFGLVQKLSANWYKTNGKIYSSLLDNLYSNRSQAFSNKEELKVQQKANRVLNEEKFFKTFWDSMSKHSTAIRSNLLFDNQTGERITEGHEGWARAEEEYNRLVNYSGDKDLVDDLIRELSNKIEKYFEDKAEQALKFSTIENELERNGALKYWEKVNSPFTFLATAYVANTHTGANSPVFVPSKASNMFDSKFNDLQKDEVLRDAYEQFATMSRNFRSYLPPSIAHKLHDNFLPIIDINDVANAYSLFGGMFKGDLGNILLKAISSSQREIDKKNSTEVPIKYTSTILPRDPEGNVDLSKVSINLPKLFELFGDMAIHYKYLEPINAALNVAQQVVQEESTQRLNDGKAGLNRLSEAIKYYNQALTAENGMNVEGVTTTPVYDWRPMENAKIKKEIADANARIEVLKKEIEDASETAMDDLQAFADTMASKKAEIAELEALIDERTKNVRYVTGTAIANTVMRINQMKAMAFNPFSAVSNLAQGMLSTFTHARAFRVDDKEKGTTSGDYTVQQLRTALAMMKGNVVRSYGSIISYKGSEQAQKIRNLMDKLGIIDVLLETHTGYSNLTDKEKSAFKKTFDWTAWQKTGDFLTKGAMVVAMTLNKQVEVTENGETKTIPLFDALNIDGNWDSERFGENLNWYSREDKDINQSEWNRFRNKIKAVTLIVFGSQDPNVPLYLKSKLIGRLIGQFRASWVTEGINTRFGGKYYDERLERTVEGRWVTYKNLKGFGVPLLLKQIASTITKENPFEGVLSEQEEIDELTGEKKLVYKEIQQHEIENMRKNLAGLSYTLAVFASVLLLGSTLPSEEEKRRRKKLGIDKSQYTRLVLNILARTQQDLTFYSDPRTAAQLLGSPIPSVKVLTDVMGAIGAYSLLVGDDKDKWHRWLLKQTKALPVVNNFNKIDLFMSRDITSIQHN